MTARYNKTQAEIYGYEPVPVDKWIVGTRYYVVPCKDLICIITLEDDDIEIFKNCNTVRPHFASLASAQRYHYFTYGTDCFTIRNED